MDGVIGELFRKSNENGWEWQIPDFPSLPEVVDEFYSSGAFFFSGAFWKLELFPNGQSQQQSEGYISLFLTLSRMDSGPQLKLRYSLGARKADGTEEIICKEDGTFHLEKSPGWGEPKLLKRTELDDFQSPSRVLTFTCNMIKCVQFVDEAPSLERLRNTSAMLLGILTSEEGADVTFKLKDGELRAHRLILKTRSDVFNRMFSTDMMESQCGEVNVPEADKDLFRVVLNYVYSGEPNGLFSKNVCSVYRIAHRYQLEEVTKVCVEFMEEYMSRDILYEAIEIADVYQETGVKNSAGKCFLENLTDVVKTEEWKTLKMKNPVAVSEFFEKIIVDNAAKLQT